MINLIISVLVHRLNYDRKEAQSSESIIAETKKPLDKINEREYIIFYQQGCKMNLESHENIRMIVLVILNFTQT